MRIYPAQVRIRTDSSWASRSLSRIRSEHGVTVLGVTRGGETIGNPHGLLTFEADDVLFVVGPSEWEPRPLAWVAARSAAFPSLSWVHTPGCALIVGMGMESRRLYYIDWLRVLAVLLLFPFHAGRVQLRRAVLREVRDRVDPDLLSARVHRRMAHAAALHACRHVDVLLARESARVVSTCASAPAPTRAAALRHPRARSAADLVSAHGPTPATRARLSSTSPAATSSRRQPAAAATTTAASSPATWFILFLLAHL